MASGQAGLPQDDGREAFVEGANTVRANQLDIDAQQALVGSLGGSLESRFGNVYWQGYYPVEDASQTSGNDRLHWTQLSATAKLKTNTKEC